MNKRDFLKTSSLIGLSSLVNFTAVGKMAESISDASTDDTGGSDPFWSSIRNDYQLKPDYINLENGYYNIMPRPIMERYIERIKEVNLHGAYYMRTVQFDNKQRATEKLAKLAGCSADELIITRNTTESLDMVITSFDWKKGDEAVMASHDYPAMLDMFKQTSERYGMVNKILTMPYDPKSDEEIVELYERAITPKTRLLMICHMINVTGHLLPVKKICDMAHKKGVPVMVDGAHTLAHIDFKVQDLNCDFFGCSLHKWLCTPLGAGMLYVKKEHIGKMWPIFADYAKKKDDVQKLNHIGTHPVATDLVIEDAIDYYAKIGAERKEARLRYLQRYWTDKVRSLPNVIFYTPTDPARSCAIATVGIKGMDHLTMAKRLLNDYKIYTVGVDNHGIIGCRITPNVYTTTDELDKLVKAITEMAA